MDKSTQSLILGPEKSDVPLVDNGKGLIAWLLFP